MTNPQNISTNNIRDSVKHIKEIADGVVHVSRTIKDLEKGALNDKALIVLLAHSTGLSQSVLKKVLTGLSQLEEMYVKPRKKEEDA